MKGSVVSADLRFVLLRFRFPPLSCLLEGPIKLYKSVPAHLDSALAAAELLKKALEEGRELQAFMVQALLRAYRGYVEEGIPGSLKWKTGEVSYPLGSALIPVRRLKDDSVILLLPSEKPYLLHIHLEQGEAIPYAVSPLERQEAVEFHNILPLRRRTNIERFLQVLTAGRLNVAKKGLAQITAARGAYRALDSRARLEGALSTTTFAAILDIADEELLSTCLNLLKKLGIGKKRDMGYGDLIAYDVFELAGQREDIRLEPEFVEWREGQLMCRITLRLLPWPIIRSWMAGEEKWRLIRASTITSSCRPPYWLRGPWRMTCTLPFAMLTRISH